MNATLYDPSDVAFGAQPPTFKPAALVGGRIDCPKCGSALNYRVTADGQTHGRCVAAACIKWSNA